MAESHTTVFVPESLWDSFINLLEEDKYWALWEPVDNVFVLCQLSEDEFLTGVGVFSDEPNPGPCAS
jgi:hypothetical protein